MGIKDLKNQCELIRQYCRMGETRTMVYVILCPVLSGIRPYVSLVLMGILLDLVYAGETLNVLVMYALAAFAYVCISSCLEGWLLEKQNTKLEYIYEVQNYLMSDKSFSVDYEYVEKGKVHSLIQHTKKLGTNLGMLGGVINCWRVLIAAIISMIAAFVIVIPLFTRGNGAGGASSVLVPVVLLFLILALVVGNYYVELYVQKKMIEIRKTMVKPDNLLSYYSGVFASYDRQKDMRIYGQQKRISARLDGAIQTLAQGDRQQAFHSCMGTFIKVSFATLISLLIYGYAGMQAYYGAISIGSVVTYAASIIKMSTSMSEFMNYMAHLKEISAYVNDYTEFSHRQNERYEGKIPVEKRRDNKFSVEFCNVSFRYPGSEEYVLKNLNLKFVIGERMAIVGKNGSGKSTFIKLLCRLYDVTEGCIKVNDIDIRKYDYDEYCNLFAVVFQDFQMFSFGLGENIAGSSQVDENRAKDALCRAGMEERLNELPQGLSTYVGKEFDESGVSFSGGEKQKMAIARAIYKDAPFVIMDEPTAALDPVAECEVFAGFHKMVGDKTAIYISHRLASCRFCQDILVFDKGKVVQRGSHEELLGKEGLYQQLWNAQAQYYV